jgi:hypothetical protein
VSSAYGAEASRLDAEVLSAINAWRVPRFDDLALRIFEHQLRYNEPYARYCLSLGITPGSMPDAWDGIPPIPAGAFKEAALCTFDPSQAVLVFETSGTTVRTRGKHYLESAALYDAALLKGFETLFLDRAKTVYRFLLLIPRFTLFDGRQSSLAYMMERVSETFGDGDERSYVKDDHLLFQEFIAAARTAAAQNQPVVLAGTAFSFVVWIDFLKRSGTPALPLPRGSKIMETGGFKGRVAHVERKDLYADVARVFGVPETSIIAEYGMTELLSQYYDRSGNDDPRIKVAPPWLRSYAVDENGKKVPPGVVGALVHLDLANRSSCVAVQTEDLGAVLEDGGLILIGREAGAELRGCSLDAESLRAGVS